MGCVGGGGAAGGGDDGWRWMVQGRLADAGG